MSRHSACCVSAPLVISVWQPMRSSIRSWDYEVGADIGDGCAGGGAAQGELEPRTVRIEVPVVAVSPPGGGRTHLGNCATEKNADLQTKVRTLLAERLQRIAYEKHLKAVLSACD